MANEFIIRKGFKSQEDSQITGSISLSGSFKDQESSSGTAGQVLSSTVSGSQWVDAADSSAITGAGTTGKITKWTTGGSVIGDSIITEAASAITVGGDATFSGQVSVFPKQIIGSYNSGTAGTAALPSYAFYSNEDMGMYPVGTDTLGFSTAGANRLTISSTGAATFNGIVGIGSTGIFAGTNAILNLQGSGIALKNDRNGSNNNWSYIQNTGTSSNSDINFHTGNNTSALNLSHSGEATFSNKVKVSDGGNDTTPSFRMGVDTNGISTPFTNQLNFITNSSTKLIITSAGVIITGGAIDNPFKITANPGTRSLRLVSASTNYGTLISWLRGGESYEKAYVGFASTSNDVFEINNRENADMTFHTNTTERMRITSTGDVLAANASTGGNLYVGRNGGNGSTAASQQELFLRAYSLYQTSNATYYGSYGFIQFNADNGWTSGARKFAITNGYLGTNFAILRSTSAREDIVLDGNGGATSTSIVDFTISNNGLATFFTPLKVSNATAQITLNDANSDSSGSSNEFAMTDSSNNAIFRISKIANTLDTEIANVLNGNLLFRTNNTVRLTISLDGVATFIKPWGSNLPILKAGNTANGIATSTYDTAVIQADDVTSIRIREFNSGGNQEMGLSVGDNNASITSTQNLRFYTGGTPGNFIYNGMGGNLALTIASNSDLFLTSTGGDVSSTVSGIALRNPRTSGPINISSGDATDSRDFVRFVNGNGTVGSISTNLSATVYATSSDYRLKENVTPITDALSRLNQLKPSRFNFISNVDKIVDGFIAHEVQDIIPEAINGEKDAVNEDGTPKYQGIDQSKIVPLLTAAIQEQQTLIESQKSLIDGLTARIETLEG